MARHNKKWTTSTILAAAFSVQEKRIFQSKFPGAYAAARLGGFLNPVCAHMKRNRQVSESRFGRICNQCGFVKKPEQMEKARTKSGVGSICKSCQSARGADFARKNSAWKRAHTALRRARRNLATPNWVSPSQEKEMRWFYTEAQRLTIETGENHEVDHIVPIAGKYVCGLHVPWNLQILPREENRSKLNGFSYWWLS